jgi:sigma-B regulation protein RsbU (phosphoserine phosphatase)
MTARMIPATLSRRRTLLYLTAVLFGAATAFYSIVWVYYAPRAAPTSIGAEFTYSLASHVLRVTGVLQGGKAAQAGLRPGDEILAVNNRKLDALTPYYEGVSRAKPGDTVNFLVRRPGEGSPRSVLIVLESPHPLEIYRDLTPSRMVTLEIMLSYPFLFLVVGLAVLFLKIEDRNAWLLALVFAGFIALPDIPPGEIHPALRGFLMSYHVVLGDLVAALLYIFLAVFPAPSPLERRVPWLKGVVLVGAGAFIAGDLWTLAVANAYQTIWLPLEYGGPTWIKPSIGALSYLYGLGGEGLALASLIGNSIRAVTPDARRKARVIVWGVACGLLPMMVLVTTLYLTRRTFQDTPFWLWACCVLALFLFPLSFAYAVVKHRVLEIPVLLRRSARYLLVQRGFVLLSFMGGIAAVLAFIAAFTRIVGAHPEKALPVGLALGVGFGVVWTVAGMQLQRRVGKRIDRAFFRNAYDARVILEELGEQVRAGKDRQSLAGMLEQKISSALHPQSMAIYFETAAGRLAAQTAPVAEGLEEISSGSPVLVELAHRGKPWEVPVEIGGAGISGFLGAKAECLVPILDREGRLIGLIGLGPRLSEEPYSGEDKRLLASVASQAGIALESLQLAEQMAKRIEADQRAAQEMEYAKQVQARLFPQKLPSMKTLQYAGGCTQARQVGGDYYDFLELGPGRLALVLADIAGKGISGALLMANLQANLRSQYAVALDDLPRLLKSVNQLFYENSSDSSYATLFFSDYDDSSRRLRYVNCGHLPPLLLRADGHLERLTATNTVLGLFEKWECSVAQVQLAVGDTLVLYTDGVTEAESPEGQEFGESRLLETLRAQIHLPVSDLIAAVVTAVGKFSGGEQADDITLVVARCVC